MNLSEEENYDKAFVDMVTSEEWGFDVPYESEEYVIDVPPLFMVMPAPIEFVLELIEKLRRGNEDNGNSLI